MNIEVDERGPNYNVVELRNAREKLGLTQAQMAQLMGLSFRGYQAIEGGKNPMKRSVMMLQMMAAIMHVAADGHYDAIGKIDPWLISYARKIAELADAANIKSLPI